MKEKKLMIDKSKKLKKRKEVNFDFNRFLSLN